MFFSYTEPKFIVILCELTPAMGVKVSSGMGLPMLQKMSIQRQKGQLSPLSNSFSLFVFT